MVVYFGILHMLMLLLLCLQMFNQSLAKPGHSHKNSRKEGANPNPSRKAMLLRENDCLVASINAKTNSKWTAKSYEEMALLSRQQKKHMMLGVPLDEEGIEVVPPIEDEHLRIVREIPISSEQQQPTITCELDDEFDLRKRWPECAEIIGTIQDQAGCGSCWAVATASAFSDRMCIERLKKAKGQWWRPLSGGDLPAVPPATQTTAYNWRSALDLLSCSTNTNGCRGGWPKYAWKWILQNGIASGGNYSSMNAGCKPYPFKSSPRRWELTPPCENQCTNNNSWTHTASMEQLKLMDFDRKYRGKASGYVYLDSSTSSTNEERMREELLANGSIVVVINVYDDFFSYQSGVYKRTSSNDVPLGGHAVRLIGWGTQRCSDGSEQKYWLAANSWNTWWGDNGLFRFLRGVDECGIESEEVSFGFPIVRTNVDDSIHYFLKPNNTWCMEFMEREFGNGNGTDSSSSNSNGNSLEGTDDDESKESRRQIFRHAKPMGVKEFETTADGGDSTKPFMAISFLLTGGEEAHRNHHKEIQEKIVNFLQNNCELTGQLLSLFSDQPSLKNAHFGNTNGLEIAAASILFQVHFLVFVINSRRNNSTNDGNKWLYFSPDFPYLEQELDDPRPSVALYYDTFKRHFGAILDLAATENVILN